MSWVIDPSEWKPLYNYIKSRLNLSFDRDQESTDLLSRLLENRDNIIEYDELKEAYEGRNRALIFGCSHSLARDLRKAVETNVLRDALLIAADGSTSLLLSHGIYPDIVVTDLDGYIYDLARASHQGSITVIHAHGDNMHRINRFIGEFKGPLIGSTQVEPRPHVYNFGGFTDGDRAAFIAYAIGIREIYLAGFNLYGEPSICPGKIVPFNKRLKKAKLEVASYMLKYLTGKGVSFKYIGEGVD
ncbi:Putative uncharacterized protein [Desulfurococcus amylolyticus 1221n]|uniref:6-hydroxymethyl-7,8-dihydropterin pyrophosphokinase n=1 Tax=Desulfurococcus amylolyticus (strain DSM 18924 / JCM 16383 / VKM B-2413 / 1221n) TaxID=490899 RepID=B8D3S1_DESA1|nr:6-hydroxymethylpterin diphosphokinase MptE-like protein [Desulfurococcus amylolyticus]ACL10752.1 Putative uncharacterized protein [Desulfurococcus amylolyticus 1221n]